MPSVARWRHMLDLFAPEDFSRRETFRNQRRQSRVRSQRFAVSPETQPANTQDLLRCRIRSGNNSRGVHYHQSRGHVSRHFFAQPLGKFRAFLLNAMQPLQFFFLLAELLDHSLHRCGHERRRILRARRAGRELFHLLLARALKKFAQQIHHHPGDRQKPNPQPCGNHPKVLRAARCLERCQHLSRLSTPPAFSLISFFHFSQKILESRAYPTMPLKIGHHAAATGPAYTIASAPIPKNVPSGN